MAKDGVVEVIEEDLIFPCPESPMNRTPHASPALFGRSSRSYSRSTVSNSHSHSSEGDTFEDFYDELFESGSRSRSIDTLRQHDQVRLHLHLYPPSPSSTHIFSYSFSPPYHFFVISHPPSQRGFASPSSIEKKKKQGKFLSNIIFFSPSLHFITLARSYEIEASILRNAQCPIHQPPSPHRPPLLPPNLIQRSRSYPTHPYLPPPAQWDREPKSLRPNVLLLFLLPLSISTSQQRRR